MNKKLQTSIELMVKNENEAMKFGFRWPNSEMIIDQIMNEFIEVKEAINNNEPINRIQEEMGDLLHAVFSLCIFFGTDIEETILKETNKI